MIREQEHNYEVVKHKNGFKIMPKDMDRKIIYAEIDDYGFWKIYTNSSFFAPVPMFDFYNLVNQTVNFIYEDWKPPQKKKKCPSQKILMWAKVQTAKTLNHPIYSIWREQINNSDEIVRDVHKKCYSSVPNYGRWNNIADILKERNPYIISDIINYRAAAIAFMCTDYIEDTKKDWMISYSCTKNKYRALNKTLMNLPGGISSLRIFSSLQRFVLPESIETKIRMMAYMALTDKYLWDEKNLDVIKRSSDEDIKKSIQYMWRYFPEKDSGDFRKNRCIERALSRIFDYTGSYDNIDIIGLSKRSVEYHRNEALRQRIDEENWRRQREARAAMEEQRRIEYEKELETMRSSKTSLPKIELPENNHIKFLSTYKEVEDESKIMHHCIDQYARKAVDGDCYLFHVDYNKEMASVEVLPNGVVAQSYGPHDKINSASEYGRKELSKWARKLVDKKEYAYEL